ncbi:response regulator transcription factor [Candidatus Bipolaricaulota bacterium]|nr:response regulator transcription factor [Candidatus Bipolaricaulota bacterium]
MIRVILADDHHLVRQALRALLEKSPGIKVVGEAENGLEAVQGARRLKPDVVVVDVAMPTMNGIEAAYAIKRLACDIKVVALSMHDDPILIRRALRSGVHGYLLKSSISDELLSAIRAVAEGRPFLSAAIRTDVEPADAGRQRQDLFDRLTPRERQVLQLVSEGYTNRRIADMLYISVKTVEKHRASLMSKLRVHDVPGLVRLALEHRLISFSA